MSPTIVSSDDEVIDNALSILIGRLNKGVVNREHTPDDLENMFRIMLIDEQKECFCAAFFNHQGHLLMCKKLFDGSVNEVHVYMRELVKCALVANAVSAVIAHNHPQGNVMPSQADMKLTEECANAFRWVDIVLLDHIIVSQDQVFSMAKEGVWQPK